MTSNLPASDCGSGNGVIGFRKVAFATSRSGRRRTRLSQERARGEDHRVLFHEMRGRGCSSRPPSGAPHVPQGKPNQKVHIGCLPRELRYNAIPEPLRREREQTGFIEAFSNEMHMENPRKYERPHLIDLRMGNKGSGTSRCADGSGETWICGVGNSADVLCANGTAAVGNCSPGLHSFCKHLTRSDDRSSLAEVPSLRVGTAGSAVSTGSGYENPWNLPEMGQLFPQSEV